MCRGLCCRDRARLHTLIAHLGPCMSPRRWAEAAGTQVLRHTGRPPQLARSSVPAQVEPTHLQTNSH